MDMKSSLNQCADACRQNKKCKQFFHGKADNNIKMCAQFNTFVCDNKFKCEERNLNDVKVNLKSEHYRKT
jgi:hypothetical protein